jgi:hypothetical protein
MIGALSDAGAFDSAVREHRRELRKAWAPIVADVDRAELAGDDLDPVPFPPPPPAGKRARPRADRWLLAAIRNAFLEIRDSFAGDDDRVILQAWRSSHIPPLALRRGTPKEAPALLAATFDEITSLLSDVPHERITYDRLWTILELLEELAAVVVRIHGLSRIYARLYARLVIDARSPFVMCALTWGINELLERGAGSAKLALDIARLVLDEGCSAETSSVLQILGDLRADLVPLLDAHQLPGKSEDAARLRHRASDAALAAQRAIVRLARQGRTLQTLPAEVLAIVRQLDASAPLDGILAMAGVKLVVRALWRTRESLPLRNHRAFIHRLCAALLDVNAASAFLRIEAAEAIRDKWTPVCIAEMVHVFPRGSALMRQGIMVCVAEGYEEHYAGELKRSLPFYELNPVRYKPVARRVASQKMLRQLDAFGSALARFARTRPADETFALYAAWFDDRIEPMLKRAW